MKRVVTAADLPGCGLVAAARDDWRCGSQWVRPEKGERGIRKAARSPAVDFRCLSNVEVGKRGVLPAHFIPPGDAPFSGGLNEKREGKTLGRLVAGNVLKRCSPALLIFNGATELMTS